MANCSNCSAPLPADTGRCSYCGTRNDMDFAAVGRFKISREGSGRKCPYCEIPLQTVRLADGNFAIERCEKCLGLFFDPGELQAFLETSVAKAYEVNLQEIVNISRERGAVKEVRKVRYIACPECGQYMNRVNFGYRSGVVMDHCRKHGVWLDNGELIRLMEWKENLAGSALSLLAKFLR
jgi:Zn-finger nucleic acid-binding protein